MPGKHVVAGKFAKFVLSEFFAQIACIGALA